jgi:2-polyprenyl-6-hydroxyphenyl methylase/3-demethylubiquinone-9 3-methyltransferase
MSQASPSSIDPDEVAKFAAVAATGWDPIGPLKPRHKINPVRLGYLREKIGAHFGLPEDAPTAFKGLRLLDIGCGGGLLCEPMARLGAQVTGIDATPKNISVAALHAAQNDLDIDYRHTTAEALVAAGETFDIVLTMEVVEHVADPGAFIADCARLVAPGGICFAATLNRTAKSFAMAIVGAEYVLGWLPRGTHSWSKFVKPSELARWFRDAGLDLGEVTGVGYNPLADSFALSRDVGVNYMMVATRPKTGALS